MLDFGWAELLIVLVVAVFAIGPKDIPNVMYGLGRILRRVQYMRYAVSQQVETFMNQTDIERLQRDINIGAQYDDKGNRLRGDDVTLKAPENHGSGKNGDREEYDEAEADMEEFESGLGNTIDTDDVKHSDDTEITIPEPAPMKEPR